LTGLAELEAELLGQEPGSPYSSNRALLHHLTLPSAPDLDIPPSPPGSPPPGTNQKFLQFLELKKKGVHFNARLKGSTALMNPSLMDKLMDFAEVGNCENDRAGQYETVLSPELWDPRSLPDYAFRGKLRESREKLAKERGAERAPGSGRTAVEFVSGSASSGSSTSATGTMSKPGSKRKSQWD
jgi:HCNGP-like protein